MSMLVRDDGLFLRTRLPKAHAQMKKRIDMTAVSVQERDDVRRGRPPARLLARTVGQEIERTRLKPHELGFGQLHQVAKQECLLSLPDDALGGPAIREK